MAITRTDTSSFTRTASGTDASVTHTVAAGDTLLVVSTMFEAAETVTATPSWSGDGVAQDLTLVDATTSSAGANDMAMATYALVNPTPEVGGTLTVTHSTNDNAISVAACYAGTVTTSVAAAIAFIEEDVNDTASNTCVFASAGTAGNTLYAAGGFRGGDGGDGTQITPPTGFAEIFEGETGTNANSDISGYVCDYIGGAADAATWTWAASDQNAGHYLQIVPDPFLDQRQAIINGLDAAASPTNGWNNEVRDKEVVGAVVRTSDTVVTITLTAAAAYDISSTETITVTVPGAAVTGGSPITGDVTFTVTHVVGGAADELTFMLTGVGT